MKRNRWLGAVLVCAGLVACDKKAEEAAPAPPPPMAKQTVHRCELDVAKAIDESQMVTGESLGPDEAQVKEAAMAAACAKLPEADRPACKDSERFEMTSSGGSVTSKGKTTFQLTVTLMPKAKRSHGEGTSSESAEQACADALAKACEAAGEKGDCTAAGYDKSNIAQTSETKTVQ